MYRRCLRYIRIDFDDLYAFKTDEPVIIFDSP